MSIPKEPRQLMINLMYIVLTAILALNVSAEILNAFLSMDKSIGESNSIMQLSNEKLMASITEQAEAYSQFQPYQEAAVQTQEIAQRFSEYIGQLRTELINISGGLDENNLPKGKKNKDIPTRFFVDEGRGADLEAEIRKVREALLAQIAEPTDRDQIAMTLPLKIDEIPADSEKKAWPEFMFHQMPVAAVLPLLTKLQNDVKVSETSILSYFYKKTGSSTIKPDAFIPVASANASYLTVGEKFSAELFLSAYSSTADNIRIEIDGRNIPVRNGKAIFETTAGGLGKQNHRMKIRLTDPVTGEVKVFEKTFGYTVGEQSVAVAADKMNVFYIGVDNPLSLSAAGIPSTQIKVNATNANLTKISNGKYNVKPNKTGTSTITVSGGNLKPAIFEYRVKKIPDPQVFLGRSKGGSMKKAAFQAHQGIHPILENFDFKAKCTIQGFELTRQPQNADVQSQINQGGKYNAAVQRLIQAADFGDTYYFDKIKVRCPGDQHGRNMNGMIFKIK